jgi:hypothetical protein
LCRLGQKTAIQEELFRLDRERNEAKEGLCFYTGRKSSGLAFMFWGEGLFVFPLMLLYAIMNYRVFRGKVGSSEYH